MKSKSWGILLDKHSLCKLAPNGKIVRVESVTVYAWGEVLYYVREIDTRVGYPVRQNDLKRIKEPVQ